MVSPDDPASHDEQHGNGKPKPPPPASSESLGGSGGLFSDPKHFRGDMKLLEAAINRRWDTRPEVRNLLLNKVAQIGLTAKNPRWLMRAAYVWLAAERQNMRDEHLDSPHRVLHAHIDATALAAVSDLPLDDLRVLRRINKRLRTYRPDEVEEPHGSAEPDQRTEDGEGQ